MVPGFEGGLRMGLGAWLSILLLAGASPGDGAHAGATEPTAGQREPEERRDIIVTGRRLPGAALGDLPAEMRLGPEDMAAFGAGTIGELLDDLSPQTQAAGVAGGSPPLVLVNGQRISGFEEVRALPPEAVLRIDILPEETALRYGLRPGSKVVNLVLRPDFRAVAAEAGFGQATAGGRPSAEAKATISRITPVGRWSLSAGHSRAGALLESERDIEGGAGRYRSLLAASARTTLGGSFARDIVPNVAGSATLRLAETRSRGRVGASDAGPGPPPRRDSLSRSGDAGFAVNSERGAWRWTLNGSYARGRDRVDTEVAAARPVRVVSRTESADLHALAYGGLGALPAGEATASVGARVDAFAYRNRSSGPLGAAGSALSRRTASAQASADLPLLAGGPLGDASANLNVEIARISGFGTLRTLGYGLRWAPARWLSLTLSATDAEEAPDIQSLADPRLLTPNVRVYDFSTGETVDVTRIDGGNPDLSAENRHSLRAGLTLRPLRRANFAVTATWVRSRTRNAVGSLPAALPAFEAAFPERFERDAAGRLAGLDARPLNFARAERDELRWGFTFLKSVRRGAPEAAPAPDSPPAGAEAARAAGFDLARIRGSRRAADSLQLALYHSWRMRDRLVLRDGLPPLDFLAGSAAGLRGASRRHRLELQVSAYRAGLGARLSGSWESGSRVEGPPGPTLDYAPLARFNLRLFADLGERPALMRRMPWLGNGRLSLEIDNVFDARLRVRDAAGATPPGLQPALLDPLGRTVRLSLRKLF